ncbi:MAG: tetratricopeptide repeat protein, partial [Opitutae bacterium]|nr:tetratricopeptide repeat protein [Opitutae bacterium]
AQAQALDPTDAKPWHGMGIVYRHLGRYDEALAAYAQAQALDPTDAKPWHGAGLVHHRLGQHEQALVAYQRAISLDPNDGVYRATLAGLLRAMGREAEAAAELAQVQPLMERESAYNRACFAALSISSVATPATLRFAQGGQGASATVSGLTPPVALIRPVLACPPNPEP